ncbi:MAG TPA: phasin family protein [Microvirga sp.]|nr:phasin family protein [Microvirga sp.]
MTTIRQLIQTSPAKANELLAKLVDTSDSAIRTRERLFAELKSEMEMLASLEEEHLFPVLRKHKETKHLVSDALADNKLTRKLLAELERTPKESAEFAEKVAELRSAFQKHVRDEKKELLPAVLKALSDEEAQEIVEKFEAGKAEVEEAKRAEAEMRRAEARREREQIEQMQEAAETVARTAMAAPRAAQQAAETARGTVRTGIGTIADLAQRSTDQALEVLTRSGERTQQAAEQSSQTLATVTEVHVVLTRGLQDLTQEWLGLVQERTLRSVERLSALARCRSLPEFVQVQNELVRESLEQTIAGTRRMAEVSTRVANEATQTLSARRPNGFRRAA